MLGPVAAASPLSARLSSPPKRPADNRPDPVGMGGGCSLTRGLGDTGLVGASEFGFLETDAFRDLAGSQLSTSVAADWRGDACRSVGRLWLFCAPAGTSNVRKGEGTVGIDCAGGSMRLEIGDAPGRETGLGGVWETCEGLAACGLS